MCNVVAGFVADIGAAVTAIAFALVAIGIGAIIEGYHGHAIWQSLLDLFSGKSTAAQK